ncbi:MAG: signal peptidase I, partial [Clostridia bacterium]|nr:signal peptidase I [Clostridia bacterium]
TSMVGSLEDGDRLVVSSLFYEPKQCDVLVFQDVDNPHHKNAIVKRVIAVGGQTLSLRYTENGHLEVTVDGELLDESEYRYYDPTKYDPNTHKGTLTCTVPDGYLFVMGDNTYVSDDSRGSFGFVDEDHVIGKVVFRLCGASLTSLFDKFGTVR